MGDTCALEQQLIQTLPREGSRRLFIVLVRTGVVFLTRTMRRNYCKLVGAENAND